MSAIPFN